VFARRKATPSPPSEDKTVALETSTSLPRLARAADVLAAVLFLIGTIAMVGRGMEFELGSMRLSMRSAWRPYLWALLVLLIRNWFVPKPATLDWLMKKAGGPLPFDERSLFGEGLTWPQRIGRLALLVLAFLVLTVALTWPQARHLDSVPDLGDPLFSIWRIAWVSHQIVSDPLRLFDGNMFHPERLTLTYSDSVIVPALMSAPLLWMGVHPVLAYNLLLLSGFVLSGVTMFLLVRALTGRIDAASIAGTIFAFYPYRYEHYPHLELIMTMWMPLTLWGLHRTMAAGRLRDGLATGLAFALQMLSSLYYGLFLAVYLVPLGGALWLARGRPRRPLLMLAAGATLAGVLVSPVIHAYTANKAMVGDRGVGTVEFYSAVGSDYVKPHFRSLIYGRWSEDGNPERQLFPRVMPVALAAAALWPPLSVARIAYTLGLVVAFDGSFGLNGGLYPLLYTYVGPYRGLRVPARFSILVGLTLAVLAGYGVARLLERRPRHRLALTAVTLGLILIEAMPRMPLERVWPDPPPVYASIPAEPAAVLAEFPMPTEPVGYFFDTRYLYFSTFHWHRLVNGSSGYAPKSYEELIERERDFPSDAAVEYLKRRGVDYVAVHGAFIERGKFESLVDALEGRADVTLVVAAPWEGSESRLYRLRPEALNPKP
jgi:hypothetical protein